MVDGALGYTTLSDGQQYPVAEPWPPHKAWPVLQEVELAFQATVDPYVRGDVFVTFSEAGVEIEEGALYPMLRRLEAQGLLTSECFPQSPSWTKLHMVLA